MKKIGVFGGTFDPVHIGHLVAAQIAAEDAGLDLVVFVPAGTPPHKTEQPVTASRHRLEMVRRAVAGNPVFSVSDWEIRQGGRSYTLRTLEYLRSRYADDELYFILGADTLEDLPNWHEPSKVVELARIIAVRRPGYDALAALERLSSRIKNIRGRIVYVESPRLEIASSWLRERIRNGRSVDHLIPENVIRYIKENRLYERGENSRNCKEGTE
jgi:nicotinate-nucleotide adenylyltransferase